MKDKLVPFPINWVLLVILLIGASFRWSAFGPMEDMLYFDEAFNGVDALSLIRSPRLTPFFPSNNGRESGYHYWIVPFIVAFGVRPFALRLASTMIGILTLAASYKLGKEILGREGATWVIAVLSIFYWHVHLSHLALRAVLLPLMGALAFSSLLRAHKTNAFSQWVIGGIWLGLLAYTYFSALILIAYAFVLLIWWGLRDRRKRKGTLVAMLIALLISLPLFLYIYLHPGEALDRVKEVAVISIDGIIKNLGLWSKAWFQQGDNNAVLNLPGRPILDPYLGILFLLGIISLPFTVERRWQSLWLAGLAFFSILPSILSDFAPHFLRAVGLVIPIAIVAGAGAWAIERAMRRVFGRRLSPIPSLILLIIAGIISYRDFHYDWLHHPELYISMERHVNRAASFIKRSIPDEMLIYFSPFSSWHPVIAFISEDLKPRQVGAFGSHYCLVVPDVLAVYVSLTIYDPEFQRRLAQWADVTVLAEGRVESQNRPWYSVFKAEPRLESLAGEERGGVAFGDAIQLKLLSPIASPVRAGDTIPVVLGLRALKSLDRPYSVFVHLYSNPMPHEGGPLWTQGDCVICSSYPPPLWKSNETIIQEFTLPIPLDIPQGKYVIAVGVYESLIGPRLPITAPSTKHRDYFLLQEVEILEADRAYLPVVVKNLSLKSETD